MTGHRCNKQAGHSALSQIVDGTKKLRIESEAEVRVCMLANW